MEEGRDFQLFKIKKNPAVVRRRIEIMLAKLHSESAQFFCRGKAIIYMFVSVYKSFLSIFKTC